MKKLIYALVLSFTLPQFAIAEIRGSEYEERHQKLIETEIYQQCRLWGTLTQLASEVVIDKVNEEYRDEYYTTKLEMKVGIDQYAYDTYEILVKSSRHDFYDNDEDKKIVLFKVKSVLCL
jgi:hypothetical protein